MGKKLKVKSPQYLNEFKCIGGKCEDSCCIGWDVDIDKITFKQYYKTNNQEMKKMFQKNIHNNEMCSSIDVDYGQVKLSKDKRCPFLDKDNYCIIFSNLGEEYLSNVCTSFPRITNRIDDRYEMSLDVSCPEAARLILSQKQGIHFDEKYMSLGKHILSTDINTKDKIFNDSPIRYFNLIREKSIAIIQNRKYEIDKRLFNLGIFLLELEEKLETSDEGIEKFINEFDSDNTKDSFTRNSMNYLLQVSFFYELLDNLNVFEEVDSTNFKNSILMVIEGYKFKDKNNIGNNMEFYIKGFDNYTYDFINKESYIFENYLVNFMYKNLFPFSESEFIFEGYIMLIIRYSYLRFFLVGQYLYNKNESVDHIINSVQLFSKTIEHHKTYLEDVLNLIKEKEFDNIEFLKTLL